jgi:hypothetical protein
MGVPLAKILDKINMERRAFNTLVEQFTNKSIFGVVEAMAC